MAVPTIGAAALNLPTEAQPAADEPALDRTVIEQALSRAQGVVAADDGESAGGRGSDDRSRSVVSRLDHGGDVEW